MENAVERVKALLGEPVTHALSFVYWKVIAPLFAQPTLHWVFIVSTIVLAAAFYAWREGAWTWRAQMSKVFPKAVIAHPSAVLDYKFYIVNQFVLTYLRLGQFAVGLVGLLYVTEGLSAALAAIGGPRVGAVVVWPHHVGMITGRSANGMWIVKSGNDGNAVRERAMSVSGAVFRSG